MGRTELAQTLESENQQKIGRRRTEQVEEEEFRGKKVQKTFGSLKASFLFNHILIRIR